MNAKLVKLDISDHERIQNARLALYQAEVIVSNISDEDRIKNAKKILTGGLEYYEHDGHMLPKSVVREALAALGASQEPLAAVSLSRDPTYVVRRDLSDTCARCARPVASLAARDHDPDCECHECTHHCFGTDTAGCVPRLGRS